MARESRALRGPYGAAPAEEAAAPRFAALRSRNFSLLWFGLLVSNSGSWMQIVAQGALVYELTDSLLYEKPTVSCGLEGFCSPWASLASPLPSMECARDCLMILSLHKSSSVT